MLLSAKANLMVWCTTAFVPQYSGTVLYRSVGHHVRASIKLGIASVKIGQNSTGDAQGGAPRPKIMDFLIFGVFCMVLGPLGPPEASEEPWLRAQRVSAHLVAARPCSGQI